MTKREDETRLEKLKGIVSTLPQKPGSYQFYDADGTIIYVGKAKNLKSRVSSYFHTEVDRFKTKVLVSKIWDISYTVVKTEEDALLLENSLIKKYNPRYNVLLKDGKTYPSICITNEYLPRIFKTRTINKKWGTYYGPYSHVGHMYAVLDLIKELYHPRTCNQPITKEGIEKGKYRVCLDYHIKKCFGPCTGKQTQEDYQKNILQAREILKGNTRQVLRDLKEEMLRLAEELRFEEAEEVKRKYMALDTFVSKSEVVSHTINNVDVFSITSDEKMAHRNSPAGRPDRFGAVPFSEGLSRIWCAAECFREEFFAGYPFRPGAEDGGPSGVSAEGFHYRFQLLRPPSVGGDHPQGCPGQQRCGQ